MNSRRKHGAESAHRIGSGSDGMGEPDEELKEEIRPAAYANNASDHASQNFSTIVEARNGQYLRPTAARDPDLQNQQVEHQALPRRSDGADLQAAQEAEQERQVDARANEANEAA